MGFFLGIHDPDIIEAAFGRESNIADFPAERRPTGATQSTQLKQDWSKLAGKFSWRVHPAGSRKVSG